MCKNMTYKIQDTRYKIQETLFNVGWHNTETEMTYIL